METTIVFSKNIQAYNDHKRLIVNCGGTSSSKTISILQLLHIIALYSLSPLLISIVSESYPHLARGCIRDFKNVLGSQFNDESYHKTNHTYTYNNNSIIEFFPADDSSKLRGGRRDILYINECNNVTKAAYDELDVRTRKCTFLDYNPVSEFWAYELIDRPETAYIHSTYRDALHVLPIDVVKSIESRKLDSNWFRIYGEGLTGNIEGLVHPTFTTCDNIPAGGLEVYGLDFGFTNDPTALTRNVIIGDTVYSDQLIYERGLTNSQIARRMEQLGVQKNWSEIYADSSEPKSIAEIHQYGFNIKGALKGSDSVIAGIQKLNQYKRVITKRSIDLIKEMRNYRYITDSDGHITNKPIDDFNHCCDSIRYAITSKLRPQGQAMRIAI